MLSSSKKYFGQDINQNKVILADILSNSKYSGNLR